MVYESKDEKVIKFVMNWFEVREDLPYNQVRLIIRKKYFAKPKILDDFLSDMLLAGEIVFDKDTNTYWRARSSQDSSDDKEEDKEIDLDELSVSSLGVPVLDEGDD